VDRNKQDRRENGEVQEGRAGENTESPKKNRDREDKGVTTDQYLE